MRFVCVYMVCVTVGFSAFERNAFRLRNWCVGSRYTMLLYVLISWRALCVRLWHVYDELSCVCGCSIHASSYEEELMKGRKGTDTHSFYCCFAIFILTLKYVTIDTTNFYSMYSYLINRKLF